MKKIFFPLLMISLLFCSCSLDRNNPLDPENNESVTVPQQVTGLTLTSNGGVVYARWTRIDEIKEYKVYRSLSYDGEFELIATIENPASGITEFVDYVDSDVQLNTYYYYKISAVSQQGLEGTISPYKWVKVV